MTPFVDPQLLPVIFAALMGLSILLYVVLDGLDLGVGILSVRESPEHRDLMVASIGPFWDANETWLVLAIGLLLVAFPVAHGAILTALYLPVALMLVGLILRGVAFEFRAKAPEGHRETWNRLFFAGSLLTGLTQGWMLGAYVLGFERGWAAIGFQALCALFLTAGYAFVGACWLIYKAEGPLQARATAWARTLLLAVAGGMAAISVATPLASSRVFERWFSLPEFILLLPLPMMSGLLVISLWIFLGRQRRADDSLSWFPLAGAAALFALAFFGLAYSFFPYVVPDRLTIWEAASSPEALSIILVGTIFVLPVILGYSILAHWIFRGKATALTYY